MSYYLVNNMENKDKEINLIPDTYGKPEYKPHRIDFTELKDQVDAIHQVMRTLMKEGVHYGVLPGLDRPVLYQPGAEKLAMAFRLRPDIKRTIIPLEGGGFSCEIEVRIYNHQNQLIGCGIGSCSTEEEKFKWRKAICDEEYDSAPEENKRIKWRVSEKTGKPYAQKQIRVNPHDIANTVLKMAKKRAFVDAVKSTLAASDMFFQDIEDLPEELSVEIRQVPKPPEEEQKPVTRKSQSGKINLLKSIIRGKGWDEDTVKEHVRTFTGGVTDNYMDLDSDDLNLLITYLKTQ